MLVFKEEAKTIATQSLIYGTGNLLNRVATFLLLPLYTRFLTPSEYGIKELVGLTTDVIGMLVATAISSSIYRFYFEYDAIRDRNSVITSAIIFLGAIGVLAIFLLSFTTKALAQCVLDNENLYYFFLLSFCSMWFQSLNNIGYNYLRATHQALRFVILSFGKLILAISLNIYLIVALKMGVLGILVSTLATSIIMSLVLIVPLCCKIGLRFSWATIRGMLRFGLPIIPAQLGAFVVHLSDRFFVKGYCSLADAGLYSLGYRLGAMPNELISTPFNQIWQPRRFELYKHEESERLFGKIFTYFLYLMIFAGLTISVLTKDALMIIADEKFWSAYKIVPIIVLATTVFSLHYHFNMGILIYKKTKYLAYINFSNGILVLLLNFILIKKYGVYGAALTTLGAFIYKTSLTYYFSSRYYKIHFEFLRIGKIVLAAALIYSVTLLLNFSSVYTGLVVKTGLVLTFPIVLSGFKFYSPYEKKKAIAYVQSKFSSLIRVSPAKFRQR